MKWINLWKKVLQVISTRNSLQFSTTTVILQKSEKYQGVKERNMILKCLCCHVGCVAL